MNTLTKLGIAGSLALGSVAAHANINGPISSQQLGNAVLFADIFNSAGTVVAAYAGDTGQSTATLATGALAGGASTTTFTDSNLSTFLGEIGSNTVVWALEGGGIVNSGSTITLISSSPTAIALQNASGGGTLQGMGGFLASQVNTINSIINGAPTSLLTTVAAANGGTGFNPTLLSADISNWGDVTTDVATTGLNQATSLYSLLSTGVFNPSTTTTNGVSASLTASGLVFTTAGGTTPPPVPLPAAVWLLGSGLLGLAGVGRRKSKAV